MSETRITPLKDWVLNKRRIGATYRTRENQQWLAKDMLEEMEQAIKRSHPAVQGEATTLLDTLKSLLSSPSYPFFTNSSNIHVDIPNLTARLTFVDAGWLVLYSIEKPGDLETIRIPPEDPDKPIYLSAPLWPPQR